MITVINYFAFIFLKVVNKKLKYSSKVCERNIGLNCKADAVFKGFTNDLVEQVRTNNFYDSFNPNKKCLHGHHKLYRDLGLRLGDHPLGHSKLTSLVIENTILSMPFLSKTLTVNYVQRKKNNPINKSVNTTSLSQLNFVYTNATSLNHCKITELTILTNTTDPHVIMVTETWFSDISVSYLPNYTTYRRDRKTHGGGVAIFVRNDLISTENTQIQSTHSEQLWINISLSNETIIVGCIYRPPSSPSDPDLDFEINKNFIHASRLVTNKSFGGIVIGGDFNFPEINWDADNCAIVRRNYDCPATKFIETFYESSFTQHINFPTFIKADGSSFNILDYVITDTPERISALSTRPPLGTANQGHIIITWKYHLATTHNRSQHSSNQNWFMILNIDSIKSCYNKFLSIFKSGCDKFILLGSNKKKEKPPWITPELIKMSKKKFSLYMKMLPLNGKYQT